MPKATTWRRTFQDRLMELPPEDRPRAIWQHGIQQALKDADDRTLEFVYYFMQRPKKSN